ncbi:MAG: ThiF family adenylyltransferase [Phycisphaerae bacterium]|nr:ThiF family adenylyltransferase [Gemmatimonadaceae bacterium]
MGGVVGDVHRPSFTHPRYARQHALREFGLAAQEKLCLARVLVVGAGGLGSPAAMYLAAAGVGTLGLADDDVVDESNLHRQLLYGLRDVGNNKLNAAIARLGDINPLVNVVLHHEKISAANARDIIANYDIVLDGTDNFPARYAINDACVATGIPFVYGSVARFEGQVSVFAAPGGPCYRCLFPAEPEAGSVPTCAEDGVLGVLPGLVGLHQSTEVIKWIATMGRPLVGRLLMMELLDHSTREVAIAKDPNCRSCGPNAGTTSAEETQGASQSPRGATSPVESTMPEVAPEVDVARVAERMRAGDEFVLLDVREPWEFELAQLPNAKLVPLSTIPSAVDELDPEAEYIVYCHHGMRSAMAANWLKSRGYSRVSNMTGGIDAWSVVVDRAVPQY